ncbi:hypothetical protein WAK64_12755 [Bacillus spongiae]|uniref:Uncharacterized protein n=1 Tax=Bacillus spongiae TaxID=2683610 RepID=A0ABU8HEY9_9BACI
MVINKKLLLVFCLVLSWGTAPFIGKQSIKRYFPVAFLMALIVRIESIVAKKRKWWVFYTSIHPKLVGETPLIWGPFFIGSIWILKWTYRKPILYFLLNAAVHFLFVFPFYTLFHRLGIFALKRMSRLSLWGLFFIKAIIMYIAQKGVDLYRSQREHYNVSSG